jgi:hypothetical protein
MAAAAFSVLSVKGLEVVLALHTADDPSDTEWQSYIELLEGAKRTSRGSTASVRSLAVTDGGAPNAKQRDLTSKVAGGPLKTTAISNTLSNPIKRGITTAISWVNPAFIAVQPYEWEKGFKHLDLEGQLKPIVSELERLQRQLPPVTSLAQIVADAKRRGV